MNGYPVFLDTEFTDRSNPKLISLGLVDLSGNRTFYAELTDTYRQEDCSPFVRAEVLPLLSGGEARMTAQQCRQKLARWIAAFEVRVRLVADYLEYDLYLVRALLGDAWPASLEPPGFRFDSSDYPSIQSSLIEARMSYYREAPGRHEHHALHDACALRASWLATLSLGREPGSVLQGERL